MAAIWQYYLYKKNGKLSVFEYVFGGIWCQNIKVLRYSIVLRSAILELCKLGKINGAWACVSFLNDLYNHQLPSCQILAF